MWSLKRLLPKVKELKAINQSKVYINQGYKHVVDIDLEKYFDTVNHDKLMHLITKEIKDSGLLRLINKYLKAGTVINGTKHKTNIGVPQGSPLSPILSNIYLNELDKVLEERGHKLSCYADDL